MVAETTASAAAGDPPWQSGNDCCCDGAVDTLSFFRAVHDSTGVSHAAAVLVSTGFANASAATKDPLGDACGDRCCDKTWVAIASDLFLSVLAGTSCRAACRSVAASSEAAASVSSSLESSLLCASGELNMAGKNIPCLSQYGCAGW